MHITFQEFDPDTQVSEFICYDSVIFLQFLEPTKLHKVICKNCVIATPLPQIIRPQVQNVQGDNAANMAEENNQCLSS
jgi:hypothetical protein